MLRTRYVRHGTTLVQVVDAHVDVALDVIERPDAAWPEVEALLRERAARPFDLATGPVVHADLVRVGPRLAHLLLTIHHVAADGGSLPVLLDDLARAYADPERPVAAPPVRHGDLVLAEHERARLRPADLAADEQFWRDTLAGAPTSTQLPSDHVRPAVAGVAGGRRRRRLDDRLAAGIDVLARAAGGTPFTVLTAAVAALLSRHGAGPDLVLGVPTAGRDFPGADEVVGPLINTVALRIDTSGDPDFTTLLARVVAASTAAFRHDGLAFEAVLDLVDTGHDRGTHPLFQVMVSGRRENGSTTRLGEATLSPVALDWELARYDLTFVVDSVGADRTVAVEYRADLFDGSTADRLVDRLVRLLEGAVETPRRGIGNLGLLADDEARVLAALATGTSVPTVHRSWPEAVRALAAADPARPAVASGVHHLGLGELVHAADVLAAQLARTGTRRGDVVALAIGHRVEWLVGVLAVWTLGAAYLAVDPTYPPQRNRAAIVEAGCRVVLRHADEPPPTDLPAGCTTLDVDAAALLTAAPSVPVVPVVPDPTDLAYVIHTSGSTGRPKGSLVAHGQLTAFLHSLHAALPEPDRMRRHAVNAPLAFDASIQQLVHLAWGNTLDLVPDDVRRDPADTVRYVREHGIEVLDCTPTHLRLLVAAGLLERSDAPAVLLVGGEAVDSDLWDVLRAWDGTAFNCYGPTEVTVQATVADVRTADRPTLGRPLDGVRVRVVDPRGRTVPVGVAGELWLGGPQVTQGYLDREQLTRDRFVADSDGGRWYRTGDLARVDGHGRLEFRGRLDDQVKVRGHRIELAEVDAVFAALPGVVAAAAVVVEAAGERDLAVHVVAAPGAPPLDPRALRQAARDRLPPSMVPRWIVPATEIPRTPAGKADRGRLRDLDVAALTVVASEPAAPEHVDPAHDLVRSIWSEVLGHGGFGDHDDFFDVGGNSLLAIAVVAGLRELEIDLPLTVMFDRPTVAGVGDLVAEQLLAVDSGAPVAAAATADAGGAR